MASFKIYQGDSYHIPFQLEQSGYTVTPDMLSNLRIKVGEDLGYEMSAGEVFYDAAAGIWYFRPTQNDTLALEPDSYSVQAKVKYKNDPADVITVPVGTLVVLDATDTEEI